MIRKNWQLGIVCIILAVWVVFIIGKKQTVPPVLSDEELYKNTELDPADFQSVLPLDKEETCKMLNEFDRNSVDSIYVYINYGTGRGNSFVIDGETSLKRKNDIVKGLFSDAQSYSYADYEVGMDYSCYVILYDENHEKIMVVFCYSPNPDKPEKFILYLSPLCYSKEKGGFPSCYLQINTPIRFMVSLPVMTA